MCWPEWVHVIVGGVVYEFYFLSKWIGFNWVQWSCACAHYKGYCSQRLAWRAESGTGGDSTSAIFFTRITTMIKHHHIQNVWRKTKWVHGTKINSPEGTRTPVAWVKTMYTNHLYYGGISWWTRAKIQFIYTKSRHSFWNEIRLSCNPITQQPINFDSTLKKHEFLTT